jgi:glycerol-3-phosphate dehydrogenase
VQSDLDSNVFDVLIVGAGIYGATLASAAARAGLSVALIDKGDYGEGASANSLKILHGGLRYLQSMNLPRMRESIWARRDGFRQLPHLVRPVPFIAPVGDKITRSRAAYKVAGFLNDLISFDRNDGLPPSHHIPRTRTISGDELKRLVPALAAHRKGALLWHDGLIDDTEQYTLSYVHSARDAGACIANYIKAEGLIIKDCRVTGVKAREAKGGEPFEIRAKITVNTTSAWRHDWTGLPESAQRKQNWVRAINVVTSRNWFGEYGVGLDNGSRNLFFAPWRGGTMIGTMYDPFQPPADNCRVSEGDLSRFVDEINAVYPDANFKPEDISLVHAGILPAKPTRNDQPSAECEDRTFIWPRGEKGNLPGYFVVQGVKYTTAAYWADIVASILFNESIKVSS